MEPQSGIKTWQWVVTAIVIIILIVIGVLVFGSKKSEVPGSDNLVDNTTQTTSSSLNRIVMSDQYPGNVVYISSVQLEKGAWVEIHKDNKGQPGAVIGSAYFEKGINPGRITLTEPTIEGMTYYAMIHSDDGDKKFDPTKDLPLKDQNGNIIMKIFHAAASVGNEIKG